MRKKTNSIILFLTFLVIFLLPMDVFAKDEVKLVVDKTDLEIGDEITVTAELSSNKKLYALTATLSYDTEVFEPIYETDFSTSDSSVIVAYNENTNKFGIINKSGEIKSQLFSIHLRVKSDANVGNSYISLTNITSSDGDDITNFEKVSSKVLVTRDAKDNEVVPNNKKEEVNEIEENIVGTFTTKPIITFLMILTFVLGFSTLYVHLYNKNHKLRNILLTITIVLFVGIVILCVINRNKKDVNDDGKVDYDDAEEIIRYLIDIQGTNDKEEDEPINNSSNNSYGNNDSSEDKNHDNNEDNNLENNDDKKPESGNHDNDFDYDVNNDGKVDVNDAGDSTQQTTENKNYKVTLTEINNGVYLKKNAKIELDFSADVSPKTDIREIEINGKYYAVSNDSGYYSVLLDGISKSGVYTFNITKVKLDNNREIETDLKIEKEILKDVPVVDLFNFDDKEKIFNFTLEDSDSAFIDGEVIILDNMGKEVMREKVGKNNKFKHDFLEDVSYDVLVYLTYDLDSNELNKVTGNKNYYKDIMVYSHQLIVKSNYNFKIGDVTITDTIEKDKTPKITFKSTNNNNYEVDYIVVNGKQYSVSKVMSDNMYEVELTNIESSRFGKYHVSIDEVALKNLKVFKNNTDYTVNTLTYTVLKYAPSVENIKVSDNHDDKSISVTYDIKDEDKTLNKLTANLVDSTNKTVTTVEIPVDDKTPKNNNLTLSYNGNTDGRYSVKFIADYNLGTDRHNYTQKNIGEAEILTQDEIFIKNVTVTTVFPKKGQPNYKITYEAEVSNSFKENQQTKNYKTISGVTINGLNYDANSAGKGDYISNVSFTIPNESGILELEATRLKLQSESYQGFSHIFYSVKPYTIKIDILKDTPTIKNLEIIEENYNDGTVTFKFDVVEDKGGFKKGEIELDGIRKSIKLGTNKVQFTDVKKDTTFNLKFYADYDLDTKTLENDGKVQTSFVNSEIYSVSYGLFDKTEYEKIVLTNVSINSKQNNKYFEKKENVIIAFDFDGLPSNLNLLLDKVIIDDKEYTVAKENGRYFIKLDGYETSGEKTINIKEVILNNGKKVTLTNQVTKKIEVLKDSVSIDQFKYEVYDDSVVLNILLKNDDNSLVGTEKDSVKVEVYDENDRKLVTFNYALNLSFEREQDVLRYYVKVYATYDRDLTKNDNINNYIDKEILNEVISLEKNYIELKDITDVTLYKETNDKVVAIEEVSYDELKDNCKNYFVKIAMNNAPTVYSKIKQVLNENDKLILVLGYEYVTKENSNDVRDLKIEFGSLHGGTAKNEVRPETFSEFIERVKNDPSGDFTLTRDFDASEVIIDTNSLIDIDFKGTLNGNGHTIRNLTKPLFNSIQGGTVKDINFENISLSPTAQGTLANTAKNATIKNILIKGFTKSNSVGESGTLIGNASIKTTIENCRAINFSLSGATNVQQLGGLVGKLDNSTIKNSYAIGNLSANFNFIGGIVGNAPNSEVSNTYSKVVLSNNGGVSCGIACVYNSNVTLKNNISLSKGFKDTLTHNNNRAENNYQINDTNEDSLKKGITNITEEDVNEELFKDLALFDEKIWNLSNVSYENTPTFLFEKVSVINTEQVGDDYDETKETLYKNLTLLMPYYSSKKVVNTAKAIDKNNILNTEEIAHIVPVSENGSLVTYLTNDNPQKIKKLKIIFKNGDSRVYSVRYENTYDMVANYRITDLKIDYTFNHYVIDNNSQLLNNLTNYLNELNYQDNLDRLTPNYEDSRIYRDFYNDVTKKELKEFVLKVVSNSNYTNTSSDEIINDYLEKELKENQNLEKMLYVYNYFRRFYDVDIDGIKLYDFILFNFNGFDKSLTPMNIANLYLADGKNFELNRTSDVFAKTLGAFTNSQNITQFLEYAVTKLSNKTPQAWVKEQFKGILVELNVEGQPDIMYTLWDHLSHPDTATKVSWYNYALPILTLPKNSAYIISSPVQFIIGAQRTYIMDPDSPEQHDKLMKRINSYAERMKDYYENAYKILEDEKLFNDIHTIQIDKRFAYNSNGDKVSQNPYSTEEPFHKNFNEVIGQWAYADGNAATANGAYIIWRAEGVMDGNIDPSEGATQEYTYHTWSHESAHNIDARLFLRNNGRRFDAGGEDYADNNLMQYFSSGDIVMNFSVNFDKNADVASNLNPERINSKAEVYDFYKKVFETIYIMDYLEGKAFIELTPEEQAELAVQVFYRDEDKYDDEYSNYLKYKTSVYHEITASDFEKMELNSVYDLYKNKLVMWPSVIYSTYGANRYGGENIYKVHWYQPHNDYGRPDSYSIKWFAYEMLGYAGYDDGYIEYFSNINSIKKKIYSNPDEEYKKDEGKRNLTEVNYKTDLMALEKITGYKSFDDYKKARFDEVEKNLTNINSSIDVDQLFRDFYEALKKDAATAKKIKEDAYKAYPGSDDWSVNQRNNMISKQGKQFTESTAIRKKIYYTLKNETNDFIGNVYFDTKQQDVGDLVIDKEETQDINLLENSQNEVIIENNDNETIIDENVSLECGDKLLETTVPNDSTEYEKIPSDIEELEESVDSDEEVIIEDDTLEEEEKLEIPELEDDVIIPEDNSVLNKPEENKKDDNDDNNDDSLPTDGPDPDNSNDLLTTDIEDNQI